MGDNCHEEDDQEVHKSPPWTHLVRHPLRRESCSVALQLLGAHPVQAAGTVWKLQQRELRDVFQKVYGKPTSSCNNAWLRGKLLQALGMDPRWRPESMKPKTQEAAAGPPEAPISAGMARPRRQRAGLKRAWDWQDDGSWLGSGEDSASAGSSLQTASSSPGGLRRAKRPRRALGQPQPPQQPAQRQRAAGSSGSGAGGGASLACVASPVVGTSSAGAALEAAAPAGQLGSPKAAGLPTAVATEPAPDAGAHDAPAGPQHLLPSVHATQLAAAQFPTTPASEARDEVPAWQREPLPPLPLVPAQPWRGAPAAARALTLGAAAPASMQAIPGVHMLHVLVPLTTRQQWQQQLTQGGGPWVAGPPAGAAWQPASAAGCTPPPAPLLQSLGPHLAPPPRWQQQQQAAARAALPLLWAELAQLASPAAAPDTCSLRRYEEEQRRYEERWRQYQREEEEQARAEAALLGGQSPQLSWAQQAEQALQTQQAGRDEPAGTPTPAAQPPNRGLPAIPCASAEPIRSLSAAAAACGAAGRQVDAGTLPPPEHPPASPLLKASQRHPGQQEVQQAEAQLPQEPEEPEDPSDLTPAGSLGAALGTLYSAWQDGQLALPMAPE